MSCLTRSASSGTCAGRPRRDSRQVKGYTLVTAWHRDGRKTYHVELWSQPTWRYLMFKAYHVYESRAYRVPGFWVVERVHDRRRTADRTPLQAAQNIRCYDLSRRGRQDLARLGMTARTYAAIKRGGDSEGGPYGGDDE